VIVKSSTTVQPLKGRVAKKLIQPHDYVVRLVDSGGDVDAAESLVERLTRGKQLADKYEEAAIRSFTNLVAELTSSGGRLTSVR